MRVAKKWHCTHGIDRFLIFFFVFALKPRIKCFLQYLVLFIKCVFVLFLNRKVNKSYKSKSCPIIVHCNDGIGRSGTYIMIDMVLNKIARGAKEIDLAATLEYLRDQRPGILKTKNQFEFSFAVVTEEVQNMLKALNP